MAMCAVADGFGVLRDASAVPHAGSGSVTALLRLQCRLKGGHKALLTARSTKVPLIGRMSTGCQGALCLIQLVTTMLQCAVPVNRTLTRTVLTDVELEHLPAERHLEWHVRVLPHALHLLHACALHAS